MNNWKVILATLVIFVAGMATGGLWMGLADRAQQKQRRAWLRESLSGRTEAGPPQTNPGLREHAPPSTATGVRPQGFAGAMPQGLRLDFLQKMDREFQLTPEQRTRIEQIITEGQERNRQIWHRVLPEMRRENQATRDRIRAELRPDQIARFEELMKQRGPRRGEEPALQPERRPREPSRRAQPLRDDGVQPRPPVAPPVNPPR